jgi:Fur family peroxide stress response transcriptional regulator
LNRKGLGTDKLTALEVACRRHGLPLTVQRRVVLQALAGRDDHPTADEVLAEVRQRLPEVSRTTVYRVLDTLVQLGLAVKICSPGSGVRFDPKTHRHNHLVCIRCEKVMDFETSALEALPIPDLRAQAFTIHDYSVHFRGLCRDCEKRGDGRAKRARGRATRSKATRARAS